MKMGLLTPLRAIFSICTRCGSRSNRFQYYQHFISLSTINSSSQPLLHQSGCMNYGPKLSYRMKTSIHSLKTIKPWEPLKGRLSLKSPNHHMNPLFIRHASSNAKNFEPTPKKFPFWQRLLFVSGVGGLLYYVLKDSIHIKEIESEKTRYEELGKAQLGGDWTLTDHHGNKRSSTDFRGHWLLLYFGFTHCPDICPEELEKLTLIVKKFENDKSLPNIQPLFITVDPERDSPKIIKEYCAEYSPHLIGFTGTEEEIREVCKKFRVYFGKGERDENNDYIVDHTIIIYLINPRGEFVNYFGRTLTAEKVSKSVQEHINRYNELELKEKKGSK